MIIFIKKLKSKEGINSFDNEKIKKDIPEGYKALGGDPVMTLTANHVLIAYKCEKIEKSSPKPKPSTKPSVKPKAPNVKPKAKSRKVEVVAKAE